MSNAKLLSEVYHLDEDGNPPELHPDLVPFLFPHPTLGQNLKHPLVFSIGHVPIQNGIVNIQYEAKIKAVAEAEREKDWSQLIWLRERPYRLATFQGIQRHLSDEEYWSLLSDIWSDSENIWQEAFSWRRCLESKRPGRTENFMDDDERKVLSNLPDILTIYRGTSSGLPPGMSWTLDRDRAEWFAKRFVREGKGPILLVATVAKKDVIAYLSGRNEEEIVVLHDALKDVQRVEI